jgi:ABC-type lipoprotein release transport system permease subunit
MRRRLGILIDPDLPVHLIVLVAVGALLLAALAGMIPAVMAYRTSVAKNLRPLG